ncbi:MAG TPA: D-alanyl-D-alanine carboxypeptidase [Tenericutes bacterium]|nr:D-alanyl-D-alanine carboxypeptidase [Mycoplasmatota bacterium]
MKKIIIILILIGFSISNVKAIDTTASAAILLDADSNTVLYAKNIHNIRSVASISKIMTAVLAIESGKLNDTVIVDDTINTSYGSGIYIKSGEQIKLIDLVYGLMLRSGNDAALMISKYVGGSVEDFVKMMNEKAKKLGMKNTIFNNPSGLDGSGIKGNYSTAYDMAILTSYAIKNDLYVQISSTKKYKVKTNLNYYSWTNKHKLLTSYKYAKTGKTGFTEIAKRTLVTTATKNNMNLVVVTLNDGNDWEDHVNLFEYGFSEYKKYKIIKKGNLNIIGEKHYKNYNLVSKNEFSYLLKKNEKDQVIIRFELEKKRIYKDGDVAGKVNILLNDKVIYKDDIYIKKIEKTKTIFSIIKGWFKNDK